jgi:predicted dehydrogenase
MVARAAGKPPRFLVLGCGSIGKRHVGNLLALKAGDVLGFDVRAERRQEVRSRFGIEAVEDLEQAWQYRPDVALITAPTNLHVPLALKAAEAGCHLFIEKPLSNHLEGIEPLLRLVRERNLITLVGCNLRFHPGLVRVKKFLEAKAIGQVAAARVEVGQYLPDWHPQEDYRQGYSARQELGGGVILDAIHEIDYVRWMLGEIVTVACFSGRLSRLVIDTEDTAALLLRFAEGAIGEVHLDYVQRSYSRTCHLIGDEGTIRWDYSARQVQYYSAASRQWQVFRDGEAWEPNQMYVDEMKHFLRCLTREEKPMLDVFEGARVLQVALAAKTSAATGQIVTLGN